VVLNAAAMQIVCDVTFQARPLHQGSPTLLGKQPRSPRGRDILMSRITSSVSRAAAPVSPTAWPRAEMLGSEWLYILIADGHAVAAADIGEGGAV
jgi:hypothetical protein